MSTLLRTRNKLPRICTNHMILTCAPGYTPYHISSVAHLSLSWRLWWIHFTCSGVFRSRPHNIDCAPLHRFPAHGELARFGARRVLTVSPGRHSCRTYSGTGNSRPTLQDDFENDRFQYRGPPAELSRRDRRQSGMIRGYPHGHSLS